MVDLAEIQAVYYMVAATGVLVAAVFYILNLRVSQRNMKANLETRQAQLFMQSFNLWLTSGMIENYLELFQQDWKTYEEWVEKYGMKNNPKAALIYFKLDTFFEGIGVLVKRKLVDPWLVDEFMSSDIISYWEKMRPVAEGIRKQQGRETWAENSEYLYDEVLKVYKQQHPDLVAPPP